MLCRDCHPGMVGAFSPLKEICSDRTTSELMELTARLGSIMPYRQAANVLTTAELNGEPRDRLRAAFRQPAPSVPSLFNPKPPLLRAAEPHRSYLSQRNGILKRI